MARKRRSVRRSHSCRTTCKTRCLPHGRNPEEPMYLIRAKSARERLKSKRGCVGISISNHKSPVTAQDIVEKLVRKGFERIDLAVVPSGRSDFMVVLYPKE